MDIHNNLKGIDIGQKFGLLDIYEQTWLLLKQGELDVQNPKNKFKKSLMPTFPDNISPFEKKVWVVYHWVHRTLFFAIIAFTWIFFVSVLFVLWTNPYPDPEELKRIEQQVEQQVGAGFKPAPTSQAGFKPAPTSQAGLSG